MRTLVLVFLAMLAASNAAMAAEAGDWVVRAGPYGVMPKSDNSDIVEVDDGYALGFNFTYYFTPTWAVEVLAATPFKHDVELLDGTKVAEVKHLPPTVSAQYHFPTESAFKPYVGLGLNYTLFFDESTTGPLAGTDLDLDASFGLAAQVGFDVELNDGWLLNLDARYIDIESDADLDGAPLTSVDISPWVFGAEIGKRFGR